MRWPQLQHMVQDQPLFETSFLLTGNVTRHQVQRQLSDWAKAKKIVQLRRGIYTLLHQNPHPFVVTNHLVPLCEFAKPTKLAAIHIVREYLQARILQSLQRAGAMQPLAFHGGTSLRFLYNMPRYSEDLDFALELHPETYDFRAYLQRIARDFSAETYVVDVKLNEKRIVHKAFVRFRGLLYELGLSGYIDAMLCGNGWRL